MCSAIDAVQDCFTLTALSLRGAFDPFRNCSSLYLKFESDEEADNLHEMFLDGQPAVSESALESRITFVPSCEGGEEGEALIENNNVFKYFRDVSTDEPEF